MAIENLKIENNFNKETFLNEKVEILNCKLNFPFFYLINEKLLKYLKIDNFSKIEDLFIPKILDEKEEKIDENLKENL